MSANLSSSGPDSTTDLALEYLQPELLPNEQLLWHGRPVQGVRFHLSHLIGFLFGLVMLALAIYFAAQAFALIPLADDTRGMQDIIAARLGCGFMTLLFFLFALFCLGGHLWLNARLRRNLFYGATNERILLLREGWSGSRSFTSLRLRDVPHFSLTTHADGTGTLMFGARPVNAPQGQAGISPSFYLIPDARSVYNLIRTAQRGIA